jgi:eukaryotic-like serine/threonine-protein kinase
MSETPICPSCGEELAGNSPRELCPRCLFRIAMETDGTAVSGHKVHGSVAGQTARVGHLLDSIAATIGAVPRVLLRDTDGGIEPPIYRPGGRGDPESGTRYRIDGEIARGGMGAVLRGRDPDLGRDVALKVLREDLRDDAEMVRRFVEEAQIGGQLQHPGIVPIYEMGAFTDRRPYFAMKLVKGRTLSSLLDERQSSDRGSEAPPTGRVGSARDLPRLVSIFEAVCQTIAYAHARGVIHRDLKPTNIMVGSFGEVQVMDWGLAKVLPQGGAAHDASAGQSRARDTVIATGRSGSDTDTELSKAGSVMGTPSYMAPEQARGETDRLDERCDVFALGSILCELLTGEPAFIGRWSGEIQRKAARGDLNDAIDRLNSCATDLELITLAKECLAPELDDRPRHASEVTARINAYQTGVQDRLRRAEIARAEEQARAEEAIKRARVERDRLRLTIALAASLIVLLLLGGGGAFWAIDQQRKRLSAADAIVARVETLHEQAKRQAFDPVAWRVALAAADQALAGIGNLASSPPGRRLAAVRLAIIEDEKKADRDRRLMTELADFRANRGLPNSRHGSGPEKGYIDAFHQYGLDLEATPIDQALVRLKSLPEASQRDIAGFLDDWAIVRIELCLLRGSDGYQGDVAKLMAVARGLDPNPDRNQLRSILEQPKLKDQRDTLLAMSKNGRAVEFGPSTSILLAFALEKAEEQESAITVLRAAVVRYPGDLWANLWLANRLAAADPPRKDEAIRYYSMARALRPVTGYELANLLMDRGQADEAEAIHYELERLVPEGMGASAALFEFLERRGKRAEAEAVLKRWADRFRDKPSSAVTHFKIGLIYRRLHDRHHEIEELREAARLGPKNPDFNHQLGHTLIWANDLPGAINAYREAIRIFPKDINCYYELAFTLCLSGDHRGEIAALREAIRVDATLVNHRSHPRPADGASETYDGWDDFFLSDYNFWQEYFDDFDQGHLALGNALVESGDLPGAIAEYREAIRLGEGDELRHYKHLGTAWLGANEGKSHPYCYLGMALVSAGDRPGAIAAFREAIRIKPELVSGDVGFNLCLALAQLGDMAGAIVVIRQAIHQSPSHRLNPIVLLGAIVVANRTDETIKTLRRIRQDVGEDPAVIDWINSAIALNERIAALGPRLPRIVHSESRLNFTYARGCSQRRYFAASASLWSAAFAVDPSLLQDLDEEYRYLAACAAAMASFGQATSEAPLDEDAKSQLRAQALEWLKADLAARAKKLEDRKAPDRTSEIRRLRQWKDAANLAVVRDEAHLKNLPEQERKEWQAFLGDVDALLIRADRKAP